MFMLPNSQLSVTFDRALFQGMFKRKTKNDQTPISTINGKLRVDFSRPCEIPRLERPQTQMVGINKQQKTVLNRVQSQKSQNSSRIKLRDYLYLAQTSASKNACQKRKILENLSENRNKATIQKENQNTRHSGSFMKRNKYGIKNSEMFQVLNKQIQTQLKECAQQISIFSRELKTKIKSSVIPNSEQMMMMYKIRTTMKQKMRSCIKQMKQAINLQKDQRDEAQQIQILLDEQELGRDIGFTQEMFNKKYKELQQKRLSK